MVIKIDISKLERPTTVKIAEQTEDVEALEWLAQIDDANVVRAVILNPVTTKEIRELIYRVWKNKGDNRDSKWVVRTLAECPLNNITISSMIENIISAETCEDTLTCVKLANQEDACNEDLNKLYDYATCVDKDEDFIKAVLSAMAHREDLSEELANKLLNYSSDIASIVAETYSKFLRIDFSKGQTE